MSNVSEDKDARALIILVALVFAIPIVTGLAAPPRSHVNAPVVSTSGQ